MPDPSARPLPFKVTPLVFHTLFSLAEAPLHAYGVMKDIVGRTAGRVDVAPGSLHFTLQRLVDAGLVVGADAPGKSTSADARRRYYRLTPAGRSLLRAEVQAMADTVALARARRVAGRE